MKKFSLVLAVLVLAGCAEIIDDQDNPGGEPKPLVLTATREGATAEVKTICHEDGTVWWDTAEEISVFFEKGEGGLKFVSRNTEPAAVAEFVQAAPSELPDAALWAVYPYSESNSFDGWSVTLVIPSVQTGVEGNFSDNAFPALARSEDHTLAFRNICGGICFSLARSDIKSVVFKAEGGVALAGKVKLGIGSDGAPVVSEVLEGVPEVTLEAPAGGTFKPGVNYYLSLLPAQLQGGFSVTMRTDELQGTFTSTKPQTVSRSVFGVLGGIDARVQAWGGLEPETRKLTGTIIGTGQSVNYDNGSASTTVNTKENVFDGDFDTYFASYDRRRTWVGLDLGVKHIITRVGYSPRKTQEGRVELALLEGANEPDFSDALPLGIIKGKGTSGIMQYIDVQCSRGFRYVRYVGPADARCNLAELEFYGREGEGDDSRLCQLTNLPTVVINTEGAQDIVSKKESLMSNVYIISDGGTKLLSTSETGVRGRGNASWSFPKKPYRLKFAEKQSVLGAPAKAKKWTLINNYGDKTLMRNILAFEVSRRVGMSYTPFCTPVDVILNGEYQGCYQLCDQVEVGTGRVEAKKGYLIEIDAYAYSEEVYFVSNRGIPVTIKYPDEEDITDEQRSFIADYFGQLETAMFSGNFKDQDNGYRKYMDVDSWLRNFIVGEFCGNTDTYWSVYMYKDGGDGVLYTGPAWDYDLAFENDNRTYRINNLSGYIYATNGSVAADAVRSMVTRTVKTDEASHARLIEIWDEAKPKLADLNDYVDETAVLLEESQQLNFKRWPILNSYVHQNPQVAGSYAGEVKVVKDYITGRLTRFDQLVRQ